MRTRSRCLIAGVGMLIPAALATAQPIAVRIGDLVPGGCGSDVVIDPNNPGLSNFASGGWRGTGASPAPRWGTRL
ncbi:MAG: hypothetical protein IPK69_13220 [Phycisphaerales bacterium]|nr:MAG: hypothetical protein IPK69_13220 [Phycisphaerales bacterium]